MHAIITARAVPEHLHGYLSRFLTEVDVGVYVGNISPPVLQRLWSRCLEAQASGSMTLVYSDPTCEQGFMIMTTGHQRREVIDMDGAWMIQTRGEAGESRIVSI